MTSKTEKLRAVFLTALMIGSVFAAGIAFTGGAAAATSGDVTLNPGAATSGVQDGESLTINVTDSDANTDSGAVDDYHVAVSSGLEGPTTGSPVTAHSSGDSVSSGDVLYEGVLLDNNADNDITVGSEITVTDDSGTSDTIASVSINDNGTVTVTAASDIDNADTVTVAGDAIPSETVELTESGKDTGEFEGSVPVEAASSATADDGTLQALDQQNGGAVDDTLTVYVTEPDDSTSATFQETVTTNFDAQGSAKVVSAIAYDDGGASGTTAGTAVDDIEIAFNQDLYKNNTDIPSTFNALDGNNVTVYVNDEEVSSTAGTSSANGALEIDLSNEVDANDDIIVNVNVAQDDGGNTFAPGNISVTNTAQTIDADGTSSGDFGSPDSNAFKGESVALDFDGTQNAKFEISSETEFVFSGSSGANSDVYVFDTTNRNVSTDYEFAGTDANYYLGLRNLGLETSADATSFTNEESITGAVSANAGDRTTVATLMNSDDEAVTSQDVDLDGSGEGTFSFSSQDVGNYTVEVQDVSTGVTASTDTVTVTDAASDSAAFESVDGSAVGDISTINVSVTGTDTATVNIGSDDVGYQANATVVDENGDGYVELSINTYTMGNNADSAFYVAGSSDDYVESGVEFRFSSLGEPIDDGRYRTTVRAGGNSSITPNAITRLTLSAPEGVTGQNIWTAPASAEADDFPTDATLTQDDSITEGDYIVHEIQADGVFGILESQGEDTDVAALASAIQSNEIDLSVNQTEDSTRANRDAQYLDYLTTLTNEDGTVVADAENGTIYVAIDSGEVVTSDRDINFGNDVFNASVGVNATNTQLVKAGAGSASAEFSTAQLDVELSQDTFNVTNAANQTISGTSNAADGTTYNIYVESDETEGDGFIMPTNTATVEGGELSAEIDFSEAAVNDTFNVVLEDPNGNQIDTATGNIVEDAGGEETTTSTEETTTTTTTTTTTSTTTTTTTSGGDDTTTTTTSTTEGGDSGGEDGGSSGGSIPGFGVGIALVAILGAALLALRE